MTEILPPWVIKRNGAYLGAFGWVGTNRSSAVSFDSQNDAANWVRGSAIARGAEVVSDPYMPPVPENGPPLQHDYEPSEG